MSHFAKPARAKPQYLYQDMRHTWPAFLLRGAGHANLAPRYSADFSDLQADTNIARPRVSTQCRAVLSLSDIESD
jgi:hypothetical protein